MWLLSLFAMLIESAFSQFSKAILTFTTRRLSCYRVMDFETDVYNSLNCLTRDSLSVTGRLFSLLMRVSIYQDVNFFKPASSSLTAL